MPLRQKIYGFRHQWLPVIISGTPQILMGMESANDWHFLDIEREISWIQVSAVVIWALSAVFATRVIAAKGDNMLRLPLLRAGALFHLLSAAMQLWAPLSATSLALVPILLCAVLGGIGTGTIMSTAPVHAIEIAPRGARGRALAIHGVLLGLGYGFAASAELVRWAADADSLFGNKRLASATAHIATSVMVLFLLQFFAYESPHALAAIRERELAMSALRMLRESSIVSVSVEHIAYEMSGIMMSADDAALPSEKIERRVPHHVRVAPSPRDHIKLRVAAATTIAVLLQLSGSTYVMSYANDLYHERAHGVSHPSRPQSGFVMLCSITIIASSIQNFLTVDGAPRRKGLAACVKIMIGCIVSVVVISILDETMVLSAVPSLSSLSSDPLKGPSSYAGTARIIAEWILALLHVVFTFSYYSATTVAQTYHAEAFPLRTRMRSHATLKGAEVLAASAGALAVRWATVFDDHSLSLLFGASCVLLYMQLRAELLMPETAFKELHEMEVLNDE